MAGISLASNMHGQVVQDSAATGASYVNDVFYSLPNGVVKTEPRDNWELGFEIAGQTASIIANTQGTVRVYQSPYKVSDWATLDTAGLATQWQRLDNSAEKWTEGALNRNTGAAGGFDLGWGIYDLNGANGPAHAINGDSIFVIKLPSGFKKLKIDRLYSNEYAFTWADLDGQNEKKDTVAKADYTGKNFGYYSLQNSAELDREPATADWDMLFTRYITYDYAQAIGTPQTVTGVLLNKSLKAVKVSGVHENDVVLDNYLNNYTTDRNTLGHNWKKVDLSAPPYPWIVEDSLSFLIRRPANGEVWKVVFTRFGGTSTGKYYFSKELILPAPTATATAANLTTCAGDSVTLTANSGTGFQYQWYKGSTLISGATNATFAALQSGDFSVKVTDRGAFKQSLALTVQINPLPTLTQASAQNLSCAGNASGSIKVTAAGGSGTNYSYTWTGTSATVDSAKNLAAGTYTIVTTDTAGCASTTLSVTLTEPAALTATTNAVNATASVLATGGTAPYSYLWSDAAAQTNDTTTNLANGAYIVVVTDNNGCTTSAAVTIQVSSVEDVNNNRHISIRPNPSNGQFSLAALQSQPADVQLQIADVTGRVVFQSFENNTVLNKNIDLSHLNAGVYLLNAQTTFGKITDRIIIR